MRKLFLSIAIVLMSAVAGFAQNQSKRVVTDSVTFMPNQVQIFQGITRNGNPKWWIELPTSDGKIKKVTMTESHATSDRLLALIERKDENGKYYYSIKFAEQKKTTKTSGKADLSSLK